ncbi:MULTISPECIES: efflux RND transporter periplasmic adaptor subunit [unclassified Pseudomonas]|uniref:efflux RND transporter periplasmic adaptor subunit n=1 Tax=unclassified Pseudomonas TaxID=196821 RepID=UPI0002F706C8|nr:efflux RND transporter periplasmic adaptor subunit [Pseudomonas sp. M47T1]
MRTPITRKLLLVLVIIALLGAALWYWKKPTHKVLATAAIPVRVVQVAREDVPKYLTGIGTVQSLQSVTVRPQIDGVLAKLAVSEGQWVKQGDLLASIDDRAIRASLDQARAQLGQSQAQLQVAGVNLKRYKDLSTDNGVSRQTLDQQQALVDQLKATMQGDQAAIAAAQVQLSYTQIRSPVTGRVGIRTVDEGNFLRVTDAQGLFTVTQIDPIAVEFALPQQSLPTLLALVHGNQPAQVKAFVDGDSDNGTLLGEGRLSLIDNQVSATTGTIRAKAQFANGQQKLWPGQLVNISVQSELLRGALVVPPQVVQRGVDNHYVYRVKGNSVESVPVKVVYQDSTLTVISGVTAGDTLVSDGQSRLKPGSEVDVVKQEQPAVADSAVEPQP